MLARHTLCPLRSVWPIASSIKAAAVSMEARVLGERVSKQQAAHERTVSSVCCSTPIHGELSVAQGFERSEDTFSGANAELPSVSSWKGQRLRKHASPCKVPPTHALLKHEDEIPTPAREDINPVLRKITRRRLHMPATVTHITDDSETLKPPALTPGARNKRRRSSIDPITSPSEGRLHGTLLPSVGSDLIGDAGEEEGWRALGVAGGELSLSLTLPTGQSFRMRPTRDAPHDTSDRWRETGSDEYTGVVGSRLVSLRQFGGGSSEVWYRFHPVAEAHSPPPSATKGKAKAGKQRLKVEEKRNVGLETRAGEGGDQDLTALRDYFNLGTSLRDLCKGFAEVDDRFASLAPFLVGTRMLRQDPVECLFQFICSSNNHISRISGMVDRLASYGCYLATIGAHNFHVFPTLDQLKHVTEEELRGAGFGYRAKFIVNTVQELAQKPGGGEAWLKSLRNVPLETAVSELCTLPGVGPKVAACIALFSLDKHQAIPVDTHVWQVAVQHYMPEVEGKSLTLKMHGVIQEFFLRRFGPYAGWAHNTLFIAELAALQPRLPSHLRSTPSKGGAKAKIKPSKRKDAKSAETGVEP